MSKKYVKQSLHKFLQSKLTSYFVTYNSNESDLTDISELYSSVDITYTAPTKITQIVLTQLGANFATSETLIGRKIMINDYTDTILSWNNLTSTVTLTTGFEFDISPEDKIVILQENICYLKSQFCSILKNSKLSNMGQEERFAIIVKVRDDSTKDKIDLLLQSIRDTFFSNNASFPIYDNAALTNVVGYGMVHVKNYQENEIMDISNDIQSYIVSFNVDYYIRY